MLWPVSLSAADAHIAFLPALLVDFNNLSRQLHEQIHGSVTKCGKAAALQGPALRELSVRDDWQRGFTDPMPARLGSAVTVCTGLQSLTCSGLTSMQVRFCGRFKQPASTFSCLEHPKRCCTKKTKVCKHSHLRMNLHRG